MPYAYQADMYCDDCARAVIEELDRQGIEDSGDTDDYPQYDAGSEADSPCHCGNHGDCVNAIEVDGHKIGDWLGNDLTSEGERYVTEAVRAGSGLCCDLWRELYSYLDFDPAPVERCPNCGHTEESDGYGNNDCPECGARMLVVG
jgi:hypothetical protein